VTESKLARNPPQISDSELEDGRSDELGDACPTRVRVGVAVRPRRASAIVISRSHRETTAEVVNFIDDDELEAVPS